MDGDVGVVDTVVTDADDEKIVDDAIDEDDGVRGESVRKSVGGGEGVEINVLRSGSKGDEEGETEGVVSFLWIGKVKARGVGEMMARVGGWRASVVTSSAVERYE